MFDSYRRVLAVPGAWRFSATGLLARLPISMISLGLVLLISHTTGSYALAGAVAAVYVLATAAFAIWQGRLHDRLGQGRVIPWLLLVFTVAMVLAVTSVQWQWPIGATFVLAAIAGAALPQIGNLVRTRWSTVLPEPQQRQTAFALESVLDEVVFVVGPVLATVLATSWHPAAGLGTAITLGFIGTCLFVMQRDTEPVPHPRPTHRSHRAPMPWRTIVPLSIACLMLGALFGAIEVITVAFADAHGATRNAGFLLAVYALGSGIAGILTGTIHWRASLRTRLQVGAFAMTLTMVPLPFIHQVWLLGLVLFGAGFAIAPTLIASISLAEVAVPASRLTEGLGVLHTGLLSGVAPGAALAGVVIDAYGANPAYVICGVCCLLATVSALTIPQQPEPSPEPHAAAGR